MYPGEAKTHVHMKTCTYTVVSALFVIARKLSNCSSTDEQINKVWYSHTMEYYSAVKRNSTHHGRFHHG
jgi:hypothetical protein